MNTLLQINCDLVITDLYTQLLTLQEKYKTEDIKEDLGDGNTRMYKRNKYFQMLESHSIVPKDNVETAPDVGNKTPTDQSETYTDFGLALNLIMPLSVRIDVYEDDNGWGFTLTGTTQDGADVYMKTKNYGYHTDREIDWIILDSDLIIV